MIPSFSIDELYSPHFYIFYQTESVDSRISILATNQYNEIIDGGFYTESYDVPVSESRQLNLTFTYTEDYTSASVSVDKTFTIVADGLPGDDFIDVVVNPLVVNFSSDENSTVYDYSPARTLVGVKQGTRDLLFASGGLPGTFTASIVSNGINIGEITTSSIRYETEATMSATNEYIRLESFNGMEAPSASVQYNVTVYPIPIVGKSLTNSTITKTQLFSKSSDGTAARKVTLSSTARLVNFDGDGIVISPEGSIFLSASAYNVTSSNLYYQFLKDDYVYSPIQTNAVLEIASGDSTSPGQTATWKVQLRDGSNTSPIVAEDELTIVGIKSGADPYNVVLTNENSSVSVEVDGTLDLTGTGTQIRAYKGSTELTHVGTYGSPSYDLDGNEIGVIGEFSSSVFSVSPWIEQNSTPTGNPAQIGDITDWTDPQTNLSGLVVYKVDIESGRATFYKTQSFSAVFEGATGPGIVFRGPYTESVEYLFDLNQKRRDAVLFDKNGDGVPEMYYATLQVVPSSSLGGETTSVPPSGSLSP